jgi:hypothetical protein
MIEFAIFALALNVAVVAISITDVAKQIKRGVNEFEEIKNELKRSNDLFEKQINED